jgi:hypothetical protein
MSDLTHPEPQNPIAEAFDDWWETQGCMFEEEDFQNMSLDQNAYTLARLAWMNGAHFASYPGCSGT